MPYAFSVLCYAGLRISDKEKQNTANRRGFSLIEAAIVLAVVGLVIGGIWVAASSIAFRQHVTTLSTFVLQAAQTVKGFPPGSEDWNRYLYQQGLTPASYTYDQTNNDFKVPHLRYLRFERSSGTLFGFLIPEDTPTGIALCTQFILRLAADAKDNLVQFDFNDASNNNYRRSNPNWNDIYNIAVAESECRDVVMTDNPMMFELN